MGLAAGMGKLEMDRRGKCWRDALRLLGASSLLAFATYHVPSAAQTTDAQPPEQENPDEDETGLGVSGADLLEMMPIQGVASGEPEEEIDASPAPGYDTYRPSYFQQFAPRNARDMIEQVPGFSVRNQDNSNRGLGQATGNVLINGERVSSKSESVNDQLARIPADKVVRIEIIDGAMLDIPGLSGQVANIVARSGGLSGQFQWEPQLAAAYSNHRWLDLTGSISGTAGRFEYTLAASNRPFRGGSGGANFITDGTGFTEERFSRSQTNVHNPKVSGALKFDGPGSSVGNLNASHQWTRWRSLEDEYLVAPVDLPVRFERIRTKNKMREYEISGDFDFALGPGRLKLIGLASGQSKVFYTQSIIDPGTGDPSDGTRYELDSHSSERIVRAEYNWPMFGGDWQLASEAAFNRLDNVAGLFVYSPTAEFDPIPFPQGTGGVTEDRYEAILSYGRALASNLSLQIAAGGEVSTIAQTGISDLSRTFKRPKGTLTMAWAPTDGLDVSLKVERRVGQLDFNDFLAEVNLSDDNTNSANNDLRPEQRWRVDLEFTKDLGDWGSVSLNFFGNDISDYVTIVPLPGGGEGVGNVETARVYGIHFKGTVRFDPIGFEGARVDFESQFRKSKLTDPTTGVDRSFDNLPSHNIELDFRHDVPRTDIAWGLGLRETRSNPYYRVAEYGFDYNNPVNLQAFVEHKDVFGLTVQARVNNILYGDTVLERTVYTGPRGVSPILFHENRRREIGQVINFIVKGNF